MSTNNYMIQLSQGNSTFPFVNKMRLSLPYPAEIKDCEVALSSCFIYYSWVNVSASSYANNTLSYVFNGSNFNISLPSGFYSISDINGFIQLQMFNNGHYLLDSNGNPVYYISLVTNLVYYAVTLTCSPIPTVLPTGWTNPHAITLSGNCPLLIINNVNFGILIGFSPASYPAITQNTVYNANGNITAQISPVTSVNIGVNLVNNSKFNSIAPQTIYTFSPNVGYSSQVIIEPKNLLFYRCIDQTYPYIEISFIDQLGLPMGLIDQNIVCSLIVRSRN